jgi:hypothetical protein
MVILGKFAIGRMGLSSKFHDCWHAGVPFGMQVRGGRGELKIMQGFKKQ